MINVTDTLKQLDGVLVTADVEDNLGKKQSQFLYYNKKWWNYPSFTSVTDKDYIEALERARKDTKSHRTKEQLQSPGVSIKEVSTNSNIPDYIQVKSNPVEIVCTTALTIDDFWDNSKVAPSLSRMRFETNFNGSVKPVKHHVFYENKTGLSELYNTFLTEEYKELVHKSIYFKLPVKDEKNTYFLAWTTTPWTLPGNSALAVHPDLKYAKVKNKESIYILLKEKADLIENGQIICCIFKQIW